MRECIEMPSIQSGSTQVKLKNFFCVDYRIEILRGSLSQLQFQIAECMSKNKNVVWYDGLHLMEDLEEVYGLCFVAFQKYIVGTIHDLKTWGLNPDIKDSHKFVFFKFGHQIKYSVTTIELINCLANYYKHKEEGLKKHTAKILTDLNILGSEFPIHEGMVLLTESYNLQQIVSLVSEWRKILDEKFSIN